MQTAVQSGARASVTLSMATALMDQETATAEARRYALAWGSATKAYEHVAAGNPSGRMTEFQWALWQLSRVERGDDVLWDVERRQAEWLAELAAARPVDQAKAA
ncbi:MAG: hypothetical protein ACK4Z5_07825 [Brevundimonas sp.]